MTALLWRYSHFALAILSSLVLVVASVTGIILAFEPVAEKSKGYAVADLSAVLLAETVERLQENFSGLEEISINDYGFVEVKYTNDTCSNCRAYVNPVTGAYLSEVPLKSSFFEWTTNLHRSLFLHETGRVLVGITAFLLVLIVVSGVLLLVQRQQGWKFFFSPVKAAGTMQYYHIVFGRIALVFILFIAITGTLLSAYRFLFAANENQVVFDLAEMEEQPSVSIKSFPAFKQISLHDVQSLQLPFSEFPEDFYTLKLKDKTLAVNQYTGEIIEANNYGKAYQISQWSLQWHTGRNYTVWAIILAIASGYILFFIFSGIAIALKRIRVRSVNQFTAENSKIVILVGSENGSTYRWAEQLFKALVEAQQSVYITTLNQYRVFPEMQHLIVFSSTYGDGEAPNNASFFFQQLEKWKQPQQVKYSVLGFGSRSYPEFCAYASTIDEALHQQEWAIPLLPMCKVDDQSFQDIENWLELWVQATGIQCTFPKNVLQRSKAKKYVLRVISRSEMDANDTFVLRLKTNKKYQSGDLLVVYPDDDYKERFYSIAKIDDEIHLSVKHHQGLGSSYLYRLQSGKKFKARIAENAKFRFPNDSRAVLMICNGTGIAPFLGMLNENEKKVPCYLYCGFKSKESFERYRDFLQMQIHAEKLQQLEIGFSREGNAKYVYHLLEDNANHIAELLLQQSGVVMICGSLAMQKDVLQTLDSVMQKFGSSLKELQDNNQVMMDCY